jgi:two-component system sensor histidine kinase CiaH
MHRTNVTHWLRSATGQLTLSYLAIIMLMSIGFSVVFYNTSSHALGRQLPRPETFGAQRDGRPQDLSDDVAGFGPGMSAFLAQRIAEGRRELLTRLIMLNILALIAGAGLSYYLARRTLEPIEENMEAQSQFVSDASHELRTPLTTLQTTNEVALRRSKLSPSDIQTILQTNIEEVAKLKSLTDSLLHLARQDSDELVLSDVSLQEIAADAMNIVAPLAIQKNITVDDAVPDVVVRVHRAAMAETLVILLDNAIKYSPPGSTVFLTGGDQGRRRCISVRDEGAGIRAADLPRIFERFYRADQSRNKQQVQGYGIGLALAQKIVHQHGGHITARSPVGEGATFTIALPIS